ncbi:MAG: ribonuclease Z [Flavobacteriales bacterium]|nr:ribonuclease Z [Flavobacteriales bacterium]
MSFKLTILGCNSAVPTIEKNPTAQLLNADERFFLIDCGEGTQIQLLKNKIKAQRINHIFISHLHGDHYFGLIGLINTMHLLGRTRELNLYAHPKLKDIIDLQFLASNTELKFPLFFHPIPTDKEKVLFEDDSIIISSLVLKHSISSSGFLFKEKKKTKNIIKEKIKQYNIPVSAILDIKQGNDFNTVDGEIIRNEELTTISDSPHSYAFCSDTTFVEENINKIKGVTLLYHEATFMKDLQEKALQTGHSTTVDAATIAKKAEVKQLLIGHFSKRYNNLEDLLEETRLVFVNTSLAADGETYDFDTI